MKELVVSRYLEDIAWLEDVHSSIDSIVVYNKGTKLQSSNRVKVVDLKNSGREAHSYIYHFIENRDKLFDTTFVCQADPFEHSTDFCERLSIDYTSLKSLSTRYKYEWPLSSVTDYDKIENYKGFEIRLGDMKYFGHRDKITTRKWFENIWSLIFVDPCPNNYYYGYAAMWAIPKENIVNRSENFWRHFYNILNEQIQVSAYTCSLDAWAFEALWKAILTPKYRTIL